MFWVCLFFFTRPTVKSHQWLLSGCRLTSNLIWCRSLSGQQCSRHADFLVLNFAKLTPTLRLFHLLLPLIGKLLIFHMTGSFLSFKSQLKCHLWMTFPDHPIQNSHSVTCHLISSHCFISLHFTYWYVIFLQIFYLLAYVLSLFLLPVPFLPCIQRSKSQESKNYACLSYYWLWSLHLGQFLVFNRQSTATWCMIRWINDSIKSSGVYYRMRGNMKLLGIWAFHFVLQDPS